ncbi:flagellar hook-length control protein FliK [Halomonas cupida]|uniref:flagellar hook-length control protein FliK n=1 Tax=Halomonas cupida TaxID=44933 RepID=UPI0039B3D491
MSGINSLIDTLLHQVLGKRVDLPAPRDFNAPVKAIDPGRGPHEVHSDSRLDARHSSAVARNETGQGASHTAPAGGVTPSAIIRLSAPAQHIADLLLRFPAPSSVITSRQPLLSAPPLPSPQSPLASTDLKTDHATHSAPTALGAPNEASVRPEVNQIALRLGHQVRDSGLFFESHLARWIKGEMPREQLAREPQMWRLLQFHPAASPDHQRGRPQGLTSAPWRASQPAGFVPQGSPLVSSLEAHETTSQQPQHSGDHAHRPAVHDSLAPLVRHQLELLSTPALRWEGDVWSGLFMALLLQPDSRHQGDDRQPIDRDGNDDSRQQAWQAHMQLDVDRFGTLSIDARLEETRLSLTLGTEDEQLRETLRQHQQTLATRLRGHGLQQIDIQVGACPSTRQDTPAND